MPEVTSQSASPEPGSGVCRELRVSGAFAKVTGSMTLTWHHSQGPAAHGLGGKESLTASHPKLAPLVTSGSNQQWLLTATRRLEHPSHGRHRAKCRDVYLCLLLLRGRIERMSSLWVFIFYIGFFSYSETEVGLLGSISLRMFAGIKKKWIWNNLFLGLLRKPKLIEEMVPE